MVHLDQGGAGRSCTRVLPPPSDLADVVESTFILDEVPDSSNARSWRVVPDPSAHLLFVVPSTGRARGAVVGARSTFDDIDVSGRRLTLGVRLRPGTLSRIARERATAFTDRAFPVEDVLGASWRSVLDPLGESEPHGVLDVILERLRAVLGGWGPARSWMATLRSASVDEAARAARMPARTFHAWALEAVGLPPKRLLRIVRLYRALEALRPTVGWAEAATSAGFADQPHLVREVRALLGETPCTWIARSADSFKTTGRRAD